MGAFSWHLQICLAFFIIRTILHERCVGEDMFWIFHNVMACFSLNSNQGPNLGFCSIWKHSCSAVGCKKRSMQETKGSSIILVCRYPCIRLIDNYFHLLSGHCLRVWEVLGQPCQWAAIQRAAATAAAAGRSSTEPTAPACPPTNTHKPTTQPSCTKMLPVVSASFSRF